MVALQTWHTKWIFYLFLAPRDRTEVQYRIADSKTMNNPSRKPHIAKHDSGRCGGANTIPVWNLQIKVFFQSKARSCRDHSLSNSLPFLWQRLKNWQPDHTKKHSAAPPGIEPGVLRIPVARSNPWTTKPRQGLCANSHLSPSRQFLFHYELTRIARVYKHAATNENSLDFKSVQSKARSCRDHS